MESVIDQARQCIALADAVIITAGAGMGVDSGLPDFRGTEGFWRAYPVIKELGYRFEEMASPRWFEEDPRLAWAFYGHRLHLYRDTVPHKGFAMLLETAAKKKGGYFVVTSNVDGQFQKAGYHPMQMHEIHGSIHHLQCSRDCQGAIWSAQGTAVDVDMKQFQAVGTLPLCPKCGALARPNILMFGDWEWNDSRTSAQQERFESWFSEAMYRGDKMVVIEMGAGTHVPSIRYFSEAAAQKEGVTLIRINPREAFGPPNTVSLEMGALEALQAIL